jgi:hypothetical protein
MVRESSHGLMEHATRENSVIMRSLDREDTIGQMPATMKDRSLTVSDMERALILTQKKVLFTKANGKTALDMAKVC